ncbi:2-dehydropantoate 2-reductase (Ketopantoate reductase) (KPA reductase) (KPR) [Extremus antarcticus]|uniref:2-dehydropantoate 2-reductase n=1 Tax=Extremus antarcticus TaxID=702011 RepID=A0AAJ0D8M7_9PEZI|nr:2-dehydropantoate 2-reductase (Ketopantoate reductase) (KPA reductase) (KPR) [Extremus antarcticus]
MEAQAGEGGYKPFEPTPNEHETAEPSQQGGLEGQDMSKDRVDFGESSGDENLSAMDKQYAAPKDLPRRIHIVGTGSIGKLVAHSLRSLPNPPPVTLLFHRVNLIDAWEKSKKQITIHDDGYAVARSGFDVELTPQERRQHGVVLQDGTPDVYDVATDNFRPHEAARLLDEQQQKQQTSTSSDAQAQQPPALSDRLSKYLPYVSQEPIHNLIVTTKTPFTISALSRLKTRITRETTIIFLQNGMGVIAECNRLLFPTPSTRPNYAQGIITHGANVPPAKAAEDPFYAVHAGHGTIALGLLPRDDVPLNTAVEDLGGKGGNFKWSPNSRYLLRTLTRSPVLCAVGFTPIELLQQQLEKVVINSVINPLTSLLDARNGSLLYNFPLTRTMRLLLAETSQIIRSLPELHGVPNVSHRFSPERLETLVVSMANKTKDNISSMLADVRAGRQTEIEYINGYIVKRGEEVGVKAVVNYAVMQTVMGKAAMVGKEGKGEVREGEGREGMGEQ